MACCTYSAASLTSLESSLAFTEILCSLVEILHDLPEIHGLLGILFGLVGILLGLAAIFLVIVGSIGHTPSHATVLLLGHFVVTLIAGKIDLFFEHYPIEPRRARHLCF
jgi:hypothetical protein